MNSNMNEELTPLSEAQYQPPAQLQPKPGYLTSQGQLTAVLTVISMLLAVFGYNVQPETMDNWITLVNSWAVTLLPLLTGLFAVINYTNSRGKVASNTLWANAAVQAATVTGTPVPLGGQKWWKDPNFWGGVAKVAAPMIPGPAGDIVGGVLHGGVSEGKEANVLAEGFTEEELRILKKLLKNARED